MGIFRKKSFNFFIIICFGLIPAVICQFFAQKPTSRNIHIRSFRYGKDPSVIRCNRGDTLHLTFSADDTGHSFFLEEFDMDVKVGPARPEVAVFRTSDPTSAPQISKEVTLIAKHEGILNYIVSKSNYRCHTYCGPMHAFEQGKLVIMPNTLLMLSIGLMAGILFVWLLSVFRTNAANENVSPQPKYRDLLTSRFANLLVKARWPQMILIILAMVLIYVVVLTSNFGTKVSGRNLGVLLMWSLWLFLLIAVFIPFGGRIWCTICPLPFLGDLMQRRSLFIPWKGKSGKYTNNLSGLSLRWPSWLSNGWPRLFFLMILATFSTTLVTIPKVTGWAALILIILPTFMALIWEIRAFCRYLCPVSVIVGAYSKMSFLALRNKSQKVCDQCKPQYCQHGSKEGWGCPYGLNVGKLEGNSDCGLCLECTRSCLYKNVSLYKRPFAIESAAGSFSEAWSIIAIFSIAIIYSILYLGHWPEVRDWVNLIDKKNWAIFGIYAISFWAIVIVIVPGILYLLSILSAKLSGKKMGIKEAFFISSGALLPLGLMLWIAFVIPMLFVNKTFIMQSASDPFGWGWDFFGTAGLPWHQFLPQYIPWFQAFAVLTGLYLSLRNFKNHWLNKPFKPSHFIRMSLPVVLLLTIVTTAMLLFFTN
jgi:polyferredoxin